MPFGVIFFTYLCTYLKNYVSIEWVRSEAFHFIVFGWISESGIFRQNFMQNDPCNRAMSNSPTSAFSYHSNELRLFIVQATTQFIMQK